jgi:hypothetical protein
MTSSKPRAKAPAPCTCGNCPLCRSQQKRLEREKRWHAKVAKRVPCACTLCETCVVREYKRQWRLRNKQKQQDRAKNNTVWLMSVRAEIESLFGVTSTLHPRRINT